MNPTLRQKALRLMSHTHSIAISREVEHALYAYSCTSQEYIDNTLRVAYNMRMNPDIVCPEMVCMRDADLIEGTLLEKIEQETQARNQRFEQMLQEKYDQINEKGYNAILKCRRCGSIEVTYDEKQTRGADEAATLFCACHTCKNRWVMR
tara:strand:- start:1312 stop:1761 length:450 start_codon:yes stop_codon:yes gene_type:complete